jgi:hypothetical protein
VFLTKTDTLRNGATGAEYMAKAGSSSAVQRMRSEKYPLRLLGLRMNPRSGNRGSQVSSILVTHFLPSSLGSVLEVPSDGASVPHQLAVRSRVTSSFGRLTDVPAA